MVFLKFLSTPQSQRNFPGYSFIRQHQHKQILCKLCFKTHVLLVMLSSYYYSLVHIARRQREDKCGHTDCKWSQCWEEAKVDDVFLLPSQESLNDKWFGERFLKSFSTSFPICQHTFPISWCLLLANPAILNFLYTIDDNKKGRYAKGNKFDFSSSRQQNFICRLRAVQDWLDLMFMQSMKNYSVMVQHLSYFFVII